MTKLQRYLLDGTESVEAMPYGVEAYVAAEADAVIAALEAENEGMRKVTMEREEQLKSLLHATVKFVENYAPDHIKQELYNGLEKLNREQEKQP